MCVGDTLLDVFAIVNCCLHDYCIVILHVVNFLQNFNDVKVPFGTEMVTIHVVRFLESRGVHYIIPSSRGILLINYYLVYM